MTIKVTHEDDSRDSTFIHEEEDDSIVSTFIHVEDSTGFHYKAQSSSGVVVECVSLLHV